MAYVLLWRQVEQQVLQRQLAAAVAQALGSEVQMPDLFAARAQFDEFLAAPPAPAAGSEQRELMAALGIGS